MSAEESQLIIAFREEMRAGFRAFTSEIRRGFSDFATEMRSGFSLFSTEMRDGLSQVSTRLDRVSEGVDSVVERANITNQLLVDSITELHEMKGELYKVKDGLHEMKVEMSSKLKGISDLLIQSERSHNTADSRIDDLDRRVKKLEKKDKPPT